ncbi:helix-turn-helix transcriptional regulator [Rhodococcus sp. ARC_M12]|uniref:winged helix-turn-helix transcriptional regulator n=1 Tax=Rhodococcus sp. ARC_M12 TaxID=2928854 RepID=UPI001FB3D573|nr:helix-turn-helix domain-containing protein [Rhodococcus sp. ARC_M12]MCJ0978029.1 helix-turn-helix transcriptional regulator [Rhodococcus sp. ARC_M12]
MASTPSRSMSAVLDLLGQRWNMRILWELRSSPLGFLELRRRTDDISSSVLATRLRTLIEARVLMKDSDGSYRLTELGEELGPALEPLWQWAQRWNEDTEVTDHQP